MASIHPRMRLRVAAPAVAAVVATLAAGIVQSHPARVALTRNADQRAATRPTAAAVGGAGVAAQAAAAPAESTPWTAPVLRATRPAAAPGTSSGTKAATKSTAPPKPGSTYTVFVKGGYIETGGECHPVALPGDPNQYHCNGAATAFGDLDGIWFEHIDDRLNSDGSSGGDSPQCFVGRAADGSHGILLMDEKFSIDPNFGLIGQAVILGGAGAWAGSSGSYTATGLDIYPGWGGWSATWTRPTVPPVVDEEATLISQECAVPSTGLQQLPG